MAQPHNYDESSDTTGWGKYLLLRVTELGKKLFFYCLILLSLMHNLVKKFGNFWSNNHEENLVSEIYFLCECNSSMTSLGGQLQQKSYVSDTLHQLISTIPPVKRQNSAGKSKIGSSTLTSTK